MPLAARADSEYLAGTLCGGSRISVSDGSDDEHTPAALRHSEETAVDNPPAHAIPEVGQRSKHDSEVPTAVAGEETWNVLDENPSGSKSVDDPGELEEQAGAFPGEPAAASSNGEVLARESSAEEIQVTTGDFVPDGFVRAFATSCSSQFSMIVPSGMSVRLGSNSAYVVVDGDSGPAGGEDFTPPRVGLAEEDVLEPGTGESGVHPADS